MPLNMNTFGRLTAYVGSKCHYSPTEGEIGELLTICEQIAEVKTYQIEHWLVPLFDYILNKQKIEAIKEYRRMTGADLKFAKEQVERIMDRLLNLVPPT